MKRGNQQTRSPWNLVRLRATDLAVHDQTELDRVAAELNGRPRQTLDWLTPAEKMAQLLR